MRTILLAAALLAAAACKKADKAQPTDVRAVTVDAADKAIAKARRRPVDANGEPTRQQMGVVPGAVLLTDSESFAISELPADKGKPLVFYCANTQLRRLARGRGEGAHRGLQRTSRSCPTASPAGSRPARRSQNI